MGRRGRNSVGSVLALVMAVPGVATPQDLTLPELESTVSPEGNPSGTQQMKITWKEVLGAEGRAVTNITRDWERAPDFDPDSVSVVTLAGDYVGACDFRLSITKIPLDPGFNQHIELVYRIATNTTGTGAPVAQGVLHVFQPDTDYALDRSIAGDLTLRVSSNVDPPGPLGGVSVTVSGLYAGKVKRTTYAARALNSVNSISAATPLSVEVEGPLGAPIVPKDTLRVTATGFPYPIMEGMELSFGTGAVAAGDSTTWAAHYLFPANGRLTADLQAFEGYHVWRAQLPDLDEFMLLGEIRICSPTREFLIVHNDVGPTLEETDVLLAFSGLSLKYRVTDRDIHNDFPYRYALSTFDRGFLGNVEDETFDGPLDKSGVFYPAPGQRNPNDEVFVVPNPFKGSVQWDEGEPKVVFVNLPNPCTIRVFTVAADLVATLQHGYPGESTSTSATSLTWNLTSDRNETLVPGIYIYYVESASYQQTGKVVIVR